MSARVTTTRIATLARTGWPIAAYFVAALVLIILLVALTGASVADALGGWGRGAFGTGFNLVQTLTAAAPIALVGLGVSLALKAGVITVGAEGQMIAGAIVATVVALTLGPEVPFWLALPIGALAGAVGGALWALPAAIAKAAWNVNEILFTLLSNYVAIFLMNYLLRTVLRDPDGSATPQSADLAPSWLLPMLPFPGRMHTGVILVVAFVVLALWWNRTRTAFLLEAFGTRPNLVARLGLTRVQAVLGTILVSGAVAGIAGWMRLAGADERLQPGVSAGIGFAGLAVAVLGRGNPLGILVAAIAYASLNTGATGIQVATGTVPTSIGTITQGILLLAAALVVAFEHQRRNRVSRFAPESAREREGVLA